MQQMSEDSLDNVLGFRPALSGVGYSAFWEERKSGENLLQLGGARIAASLEVFLLVLMEFLTIQNPIKALEIHMGNTENVYQIYCLHIATTVQKTLLSMPSWSTHPYRQCVRHRVYCFHVSSVREVETFGSDSVGGGREGKSKMACR